MYNPFQGKVKLTHAISAQLLLLSDLTLYWRAVGISFMVQFLDALVSHSV